MSTYGKKEENKIKLPPGPPALSAESRENQLIALAVNCAEQQMRDGTASSQVITHFLKLASTRERLELEKLKKENTLIDAKVDAINSAKEIKELYANAITAFKGYSMDIGEEDDDNDEF